MADAGCSSPTDDDTNCGDEVCEGGETQVTRPEDCSYPDSCTDTDGGVNIYVQGIAYGYQNGYPYNYTDYCGENATLLVEFWCSGDVCDYSLVDCLEVNMTACSSGVCA